MIIRPWTRFGIPLRRVRGRHPRSQATAVQRQNLIDVKGLVYSPQRGDVAFTAPLFGDDVAATTRSTP